MTDKNFDSVEQLVSGFLRGYRRWLIADDRGLSGVLRSVAVTQYVAPPWRPGVNQAIHAGRHIMGSPHPAPLKGCTCGFYAHHSPNQYMGASEVNTQIAYGSIKATGRVILGDSGFKAQLAEIEALVVPSRMRSTIHTQYPNVRFFSSFIDLVKEFPPIPVDELLPPPEPPRPPVSLTLRQLNEMIAITDHGGRTWFVRGVITTETDL